MVTTLNITLDDDVADDLRARKDALGLTWPEFLEWAGEQAAGQAAATGGRETGVERAESSPDPDVTEQPPARARAQEPPRDTAEDEPPESTDSVATDDQGPDVDRDRLRDALPGDGELLEARVDAIVAMYRYLQEHGHAEKSDLLEVVDVDAVGYASPASVWSNMVKGRDSLRSLPGVSKPSTGRTRWRYAPEDSGGSGVYDPTEEF